MPNDTDTSKAVEKDIDPILKIQVTDPKNPTQHAAITIMSQLSGGFHVYILKPDIPITKATSTEDGLRDSGSIISYSNCGNFLHASTSTSKMLKAVEAIVKLLQSKGAEEIASLGPQQCQRKLKVCVELDKTMKLTNFPEQGALYKNLQNLM